MAINVIKISRVSPATASVDPLIVPLSFFDLQWLKLNPTEKVFFYKLTESSSRDSFYSSILPKLERSLSLVLTHFLQFTGHLKWGLQDPKPHLVVLPGDIVSLTIAEADADFSRISGRGLRHELELRPLIPELPVYSDSAAVLSLQVTLFPNQGFCIGITAHHVVMDGKTAEKFDKAWAHTCKHGSIPKNLPTVLDRSVVSVPAGLEERLFELLPYLILTENKENARTLMLPPVKEINAEDNVLRTTIEMTPENIEKLKERAKKESSRAELHLSTFVVTFAHVWTCMVKARGGDADRPVRFMYAADFRDRLDPPVPMTYFGNCVLAMDFYKYKAKTFLGDDGFVNTVEILSDSVKSLRTQGVESTWKLYEEGTKTMKWDTQLLVVTGSNQIGMYDTDFGWGRPVHTETMSIYKNDEFSMSKRRDGVGGVEIGLSLKKCEMDVFLSLFANGLETDIEKISSGF